MQVLNLVGSGAVQAVICQNVLYSRSLLRCAALREVVSRPSCLKNLTSLDSDALHGIAVHDLLPSACSTWATR